MIRKNAKMACLVGLAFVAGIAVNQYSVLRAQSNMVYELRTYTTNEGKLPLLLDRFGGGEIDLFHKHGMTSVGYWVPDDEELSMNTLVYMVAHDNRDAASASWRAFGQDPDWQEMSRSTQVDGQFLAQRPEVLFLNPTDFSPAK
ncbi:MAG: NIPSNAP family protein [Vicinamibacterales bacterium]|jgi:hypothetical protein|nr:NIPSNAP family protein [Vicinamibacterales bacterium]